ncbi:hypothetical protein DQ384_37200 [Sphaerisporangium album]|uniref:Sporulation protein n=1 Tax=Sphaerisporangium album TaxID=509200 RepID=A0A367EPZ2_9ACTN|nr:hypothetical protein [Sphaerisporangium album]RCG20154.1 hypothetical protein DQ384_37200 [Sphaerisporangium album]
MDARQFFEHLSGARRVYGDPYEKDGVTVIPVLTVRTAGGFGRGERRGTGPDERDGGTAGTGTEVSTDFATDGGEGGGGSAVARPVGAYVIKDGEARWEPVIDVNRIVLGGQILLGLALILFARHLRRRDR